MSKVGRVSNLNGPSMLPEETSLARRSPCRLGQCPAKLRFSVKCK